MEFIAGLICGMFLVIDIWGIKRIYTDYKESKKVVPLTVQEISKRMLEKGL